MRISWSAKIAVAAAVCLAATSCSSDGGDPKAARDATAAFPTSSVNDAMLSCMKTAGWEGEMQRGGGMSFGTVPDEQMSQYNTQFSSCVDETGWGDLAALTSDQRRKMYDLEVKEYQCLTALGLSPAEPPTEQTYIDTFDSADQYFAVKEMNLTDEQTNECPPPTWFMNW